MGDPRPCMVNVRRGPTCGTPSIRTHACRRRERLHQETSFNRRRSGSKGTRRILQDPARRIIPTGTSAYAGACPSGRGFHSPLLEKNDLLELPWHRAYCCRVLSPDLLLTDQESTTKGE